jgi:hypothetical protein
MEKDIIVLHAKDVKRALPKVANKAFTWLYLGQDIKQRENVSRVLGEENRHVIGDMLQQVALREKQPFLDFIAELGLRQKNKLHWWASNTAYKSPLVSDFFLLWCYAALFDEVCSQKKRDRENLFLVFVEDCWLYRHLWKRCKENDSSFKFLSRKSVIPELLKLMIRGVAIRGYSLVKAGQQIWQAKGIVSRKKAPNPVSDDKESIYIYSWVRDRFFKENGEFESPYFGRLPRFVSDDGRNVVYIAELFLPPALRSRCLNQGDFKFIFLDDYINLWSMVRSSLSIFSISSFTGSPLKILLLREIVHEFSSLSFPFEILQYVAFKRCLKEIKQERATIIYPFENQPWDKMLCIAAKELDKDIKLIGYQHSTVSLSLLNYFLGVGECSNMPLPHLIVTNGEYTLNLLRDAGYGETELVNGGALRYEYINKIDKGWGRKNGASKTILVAMTYSRSLTEELLISLFDAFVDLGGEEIRFVIKFHPEVPLESLRIQLPAWPAYFQKTDKPIPEILPEVNLVIYSSSTVGLEALLHGVPVVRYCSEHSLDLDPLGAFDETMIRSCSEENLREVILSVLKQGSSYATQQSALSRENINKFLSPVDENVWRQVVKN